MTNLVLTQQNGTIFEIIFNRPEKRNAVNQELYEGFEQALHEAMLADDARVVTIRGEGKIFSAGIDVTSFMNMANRYGENWQRHMRIVTDDFQRVLTRLEKLEKPTILLAHGRCLGLAMELALACDMRLCEEGTLWGLPETRLGMIPDVGGTTRLTRLIGPGRAKELIFSGKQIPANLAEKWGLVNYVVPAGQLMTKAQELADEIAQAAPLAVGMAKRVIDGLSDIDRGLQLEGWAQSQLFQTEDFMEAIQSFLMKKPPNFKGK